MHAEREPDIRGDERAHAAEVFRGDANDGVRLAVDLDVAPDDVRAPAHSFPKAVARHYHREVRVRPRFLRVVEAAEDRLHAHEREEVFRSEEDETAAHPFVAANAGDGEFERGQVSENVAAVFAQLTEFVVGELAEIALHVLARRENAHHFLRLHRDDRSEHGAVDDGEDGGVDADREGEGEDGDGGETRRFAQLPEGEFEILDHGFLVRCAWARGWIQESD